MKRRSNNSAAMAMAVAAVLPLAGGAAHAQAEIPTAGVAPTTPAPAAPETPQRPSARALLDAGRGEDLLRGNGSRLGYVLTHGAILPGSETVMVDGARLSPGSGYTLSPDSGTLLFAQPVRTDQSIVVRYRFQPGKQNAAGGAVLGLPLLSFRGVGGGSFGFSFAMNRGEGEGAALAPLMGLRSEAANGKGFSGLLYLSGGAFGSQARSLLGDPNQKPATPSAGHLIDQRFAAGGARSNISLSYQNVSADFSGFAALRDGKAAAADVLSRLEKEKGISRLGLTGGLGIGGTLLNFSHSDLSAQGAGITRQGLSLKGGGFSVTANYLTVDSAFTRFKDIAEADRAELEKFKGGKKFDLAGQWKIGRAFAFEGNLLDQSQGKDKQNGQKTQFSLTPGGGTSLMYLREVAGQTKDGKEAGTSRNVLDFNQKFGSAATARALRETVTKTENGKTVETATRLYEFATNPGAGTSFAFLSRAVTTTLDGNEKDDTLTRFAGKSLLGSARKGIELRGVRETQSLRDNGKKASDIATTLYGFRTQGMGALTLNYESRLTTTDAAAGAALKRDSLTTVDGALRLARNARTSFTFLSNVVEQGANRTETSKQAVGVEMGRGFLYRRSLDLVRSSDGKDDKENRTEWEQWALDPAARITGSGERKAVFGDGGKSEVNEKWNGKLAVGSLSIKADSYELRREGLGLPSEKVYNVDSKMPLSRDWALTYTAYQRTQKDEKARRDYDELGSELAARGKAGSFTLIVRNLTYDNRLDSLHGYSRQEIVVAPLRGINWGAVKDAKVSVAYSTDRVDGKAGQGRSRKLSYGGLVGPHRIAFTYGDSIVYQGPDTLTKSFLFDSDPNRRLHVGLYYGVRNVAGQAPIFVRSWDLDLKVAKGQTIAYDFTSNKEKPDGSIEKMRTESLSYVADWGRGGKITAGYKFIDDPSKRTVMRGASFSLLSPTSDVTACEAQYAREMLMRPEGRTLMQSYVLKYLFQPDDGTKVEVMAKWIDREGEEGAKVEPDEVQANVDVKVGL